MHGPGKADDEARIKKLLVSHKWDDRIVGLAQLDEAYRMLISGYVRRWSDKNGLRLTAEEVRDIWRETVEWVTKYVFGGTFQYHGRLKGYLSTIARRRAIDILRKRVKGEVNIDSVSIPARVIHSYTELLEELECCYHKLPESQRLVIRFDVMLFFHAGEEWVSLDELTKEINEQCGTSLPKSTVGDRRWRARKKLRRLLQQRGCGE